MNTKGQEFLEKLEKELLIGDGAFATLLYAQGTSLERSYEQLNLTQPDLVKSVHRQYLDAGCEVIETNSFCANQHKQKRFGLEKQVSEMARSSAQIAQSVAGREIFVAGAVGPLARKRRELDEYTEEDMRALYRETMQSLVEGGVDILMLETFSHLFQLTLALEEALKFEVPVICQMAFGEEGTTEAGVTAERAAQKLSESGAHVIGANCRSGPGVLQEVLERQKKHTNCMLSVYPNAGYAQEVDGRYIYQASPQYFADELKALVQAGATLIGGCCGTTPEHVRTLAEAAKRVKPIKREKIFIESVPEPKESDDLVAGTAFLSVLSQSKRFVTVEIEPPRGLDLKKSLEGARVFARAGCDALNVPDNALAVVRMDNVIFAELLRQHVELPVILHLTCRDKNIIALQSDLLGAQMVGIDAILAVTGDPASIGDQPGASSVYDINSIGLIEMIASLNRGVTITGSKIHKKTDFAIGVAINPNVTGKKGLEGAFFKLKKKIHAGAHFAESQPMYTPETISSFIQAWDQVNIPICVGLMPIVSQRNAEFLHNEVPGIRIPEEVRKRFVGLNKKEGEKEGLKISKELVDVAIQKGARRFYLVPPFFRYELIAEIVQYIKKCP